MTSGFSAITALTTWFTLKKCWDLSGHQCGNHGCARLRSPSRRSHFLRGVWSADTFMLHSCQDHTVPGRLSDSNWAQQGTEQGLPARYRTSLTGTRCTGVPVVWPTLSELHWSLTFLLHLPPSSPLFFLRGQTHIPLCRKPLLFLLLLTFYFTGVSPYKSFAHWFPFWCLLLRGPELTHSVYGHVLFLAYSVHFPPNYRKVIPT